MGRSRGQLVSGGRCGRGGARRKQQVDKKKTEWAWMNVNDWMELLTRQEFTLPTRWMEYSNVRVWSFVSFSAKPNGYINKSCINSSALRVPPYFNINFGVYWYYLCIVFKFQHKVWTKNSDTRVPFKRTSPMGQFFYMYMLKEWLGAWLWQNMKNMNNERW